MLFWCFAPSSAHRARLEGDSGISGTFGSPFGNLSPGKPPCPIDTVPPCSPWGAALACPSPWGGMTLLPASRDEKKSKISPDVPVQLHIPSTGDQQPQRASWQDTGWFGDAAGSSEEPHAPQFRASTHIPMPRDAPGSRAPTPAHQV